MWVCLHIHPFDLREFILYRYTLSIYMNENRSFLVKKVYLIENIINDILQYRHIK